jgi:hypothetical protein
MSWIYDDFTGTNGANPAGALWAITEPSSTTVDIQSNALRINVTGGAASKAPAVTSTIRLYGDPVDVQIDFSALAEGADYNYAGLAIWDNPTTKIAYIQAIQLSGAKKWRSAYNYGSWVYPTTVARTNNNGKLRLKRTGTTVETWYQDGGGNWTQLDTITGFVSAGTELEFHVVIFAGTGGNPTCTFDNMIVNEGAFITINGAATMPSITFTPGHITGAGGVQNFDTYAENTFPAPTIEASGNAAALIKADITLPAPVCIANTPAAAVFDASLPALECTGEVESSLVSNAVAVMPKPLCGGSCIAGSVVNAACSMPAIECAAETVEGISLTMPSWTFDAAGLTGSVGGLVGVLTALTALAGVVTSPRIDGAVEFKRLVVSAAGAHGSIGALAVETRRMRMAAAGFTYRADADLSMPIPVSRGSAYTVSENNHNPDGMIVPALHCYARLDRFTYA